MSRPIQSLVVGVLVIVAAVTSAGAVLALDDADAASPLADQPATSERSITVSASGEAQTQPDTATVRLAVEKTDDDVSAARTTVAEKVSSVTAALTEMGIPEDAIRTTDYRIYQDDRRERTPSGGDSAPVYRATHLLTVDVNETERVGAVIDAAVDAGATDIHDVRFTLSKETRQQLQNEALTEAMSAAKSQADTLAQSADLQIRDVASVQTADASTPRPYFAVETAAVGDAGTDISTGPVTVSASVTVTYNASA